MPVAASISREVSALIGVAVVTRAQGSRIWVDYLGEAVPCLGRGIRVLPGDEVEMKRRPDTTYAIVGFRPRRGEVVRLGTNGRRRVVVANLDQVVVIAAAGSSLKRPLRRPAGSRPEIVLVINKCDLEDERSTGSRVAGLVERGAEVVLTSATSGQGLPELRSRLEGRVSALVGVAGAGKSSLIQALYPGYDLRESTGELYPLPGGGYLAV